MAHTARSTDPLLIDLPAQVLTQRLLLRFPRSGDGPMLNAALVESIDELQPWMVWARTVPPLAESEAYCRRMVAKVALREDLPMFIFERAADGGEGRLVGATGLHRIDWDVPRFEVGYWRRTGCGGQGFIAEAVGGLVAMAFESLGARRVEIRCDDNNAASRRVAERNGFTLEGILRNDSLTPAGEIRSTCVYARLAGD
jgi:ribosomal-protein-serine acetyltransferase